MVGIPRRVVTGIDETGRSCVVEDAPLPHKGGQPAIEATAIWSGETGIIDNTLPVADCTGPFRPDQMGQPIFSYLLIEFAPGFGREDPGMHSTDTADHFVVAEGEIVLVLEAGEVVFRQGDLGVLRGIEHGWRNDTDKPARLVTMTMPARPAGAA